MISRLTQRAADAENRRAANANRWADSSKEGSMTGKKEIEYLENKLDEIGIPRETSTGIKYTLYGRVELWVMKSAQHGVQSDGLTAAQKEEVRQMIQSALDTGSA